MAGLSCETCKVEVAERPFDEGIDDVVLCGECYEALRARLREVLEVLGVDVPRNLYRKGRTLRWHPAVTPHPLEGGGEGGPGGR